MVKIFLPKYLSLPYILGNKLSIYKFSKFINYIHKFNVDICGKKPLEKILMLTENIKKSVDWFQIFE